MNIEPLAFSQLLESCRTSTLPIAVMDAQFHMLCCSSSALPLLRGHELSSAFRYLTVPTQGAFVIRDFYPRSATALPFEDGQQKYYLLYFAPSLSAKALQERKDFVEDLAHELGHPLSILMGCTEVLMEEYTEQLPSGAMDLIHTIDSSTQEVMHLTQNLTTLSRICVQDSGDLTLQSLDLCSWLSAYCARMNALLSSSSGQVFFSTSLHYLPVDVEPFLLERILANLIYNSLRHSGQREVFVQLEQEEEILCITVFDHGIGMQPEELEHFFSRDHAPSPDGHGLGLSIVAACAEVLGAKLEVSSTLGKGTSVCIRLPKLPCSGRMLSLRSPLFDYSSQLFSRSPFHRIF